MPSRHGCHAAHRAVAGDDATQVVVGKARLELSNGVRIGSNFEESNALSRFKACSWKKKKKKSLLLQGSMMRRMLMMV